MPDTSDAHLSMLLPSSTKWLANCCCMVAGKKAKMSIARHLAFIVARFVAIDIADWSLEILLDYAVDPPASHGAALRLPYLPHSLDGSLMSIVWSGHGHSQQPRPLSCDLTITAGHLWQLRVSQMASKCLTWLLCFAACLWMAML